MAERKDRIRVFVIGYAAKGPGVNGAETEKFWDSLVEGKSGITLLQPEEEFKDCKVKIGGQLPPIDISIMPPKDQKRNHAVTHLSAVLGYEALKMAGRLGNDGKVIVNNEEERYRIGCVVGSATSGIAKLAEVQDIIREKGEDKVGAFESLQILPERPEIYLCKLFDIKGVNFLPVSACASGGVSIGVGVEYLRSGRVDLVVTGGVERPLSTPTQAHISKSLFTNMAALARLYDGTKNAAPYKDPTKISRPFSTDRYGFVMAEGGAQLILATEEYVMKNKTPVFAEIAGYGITNDAFHHDTSPSGIGAKMSMKLALIDAHLSPEEVDYVNAHATSTPEGDEKESWAIKEVFGQYAAKLSINAPKSMTGHLTGASGALEGWQCVMTINRGIIPPTINQDNGSIAPDLDFTPNVARRKCVGVAVSNSFGFGGGNVSLVFKEARLPGWV